MDWVWASARMETQNSCLDYIRAHTECKGYWFQQRIGEGRKDLESWGSGVAASHRQVFGQWEWSACWGGGGILSVFQEYHPKINDHYLVWSPMLLQKQLSTSHVTDLACWFQIRFLAPSPAPYCFTGHKLYHLGHTGEVIQHFYNNDKSVHMPLPLFPTIQAGLASAIGIK